MKAQTSLEYLLILAAVASLSVAVIGAYSHFIAKQKAGVYGFIANETNSLPANTTGLPTAQGAYIYAQMPDVSYVNRSSDLFVVFSLPQGSYISYATVEGASGATILPGFYYNVSYPVGVVSFSIVPHSTGELFLNVLVQVSGTDQELRNMSVRTYAETAAQGAGQGYNAGFSASIARRNESVVFNVTAPNQTLRANEWSHCIEVNFWGNPLPTDQQCPGAQWEYFQWSPSCYQGWWPVTETYCVALQKTNTTISAISQSHSFEYNISLHIYNASTSLYSNLTSIKSSGKLEGAGGAPDGNASVYGQVSGEAPQPYYSLVVLNTSGYVRPSNQSNYYTYKEALSNLVATMDYYNGSSPADASPIQTAMGSFNSASQRLTGSGAAAFQGCEMVEADNSLEYSCRPISPLVYGNITAHVDAPVANQSLLVEGSVVNIR